MDTSELFDRVEASDSINVTQRGAHRRAHGVIGREQHDCAGHAFRENAGSPRTLDSQRVDALRACAAVVELADRTAARPHSNGPTGAAGHAAGDMPAGLVGSERVRRHSHHRARSAPRCGVSRGPRAYRVRVPSTTAAHAAVDSNSAIR